jgi:hypothetical protein
MKFIGGLILLGYAAAVTFGWDRLADDDRGLLPAAILAAPGGIWAWHDGFQGGK